MGRRMISTALHRREEGGRRLHALWWQPPEPVRVASTSVVGGGIGVRGWLLNAQVAPDYARCDVEDHLVSLAVDLGLRDDPPGVGMLTAVDVQHWRRGADGGVDAVATVGLGHPTWAAADEPVSVPSGGAGTINVWAWVPERLTDAALVNAVATATEAKAQALGDLGVAATGTASDAVCVCCPPVGTAEPFAGPRSTWGARLARAVHAAVRAGAAADLAWRRRLAPGAGATS